jgi:integrase
MAAANPPKYRHYRPKNLAVVRIDGLDIYLGKYDSPESWEKYGRVLAEWRARYVLPVRISAANNSTSAGTLIVNEVILAFWRHGEKHYRHPDGSSSGELRNFRDSLLPLRQLYGSTRASDFSPLKLKAVRQAMIDAGLARTTINQRIGRIVRVFKWAASEELVPAAVYLALKTVSGLPKGRSEAREPEPVRPVPDVEVEAIKPHVARQVWAMIELQRLTGMRPGEVVIMRGCDIDRAGDVWSYTPAKHKTAHHGKGRRVPIGPRAQEVLMPWLRPDPSEYLFSPREAMGEFRAEQRLTRKTPLYPSQRDRKRNPNTNVRLRNHYTTQTYNHAIGYGCRRAGIPLWHANQLRHSAAIWIRRHTDLDAARTVLGHSDLKTSEIYAQRDWEQAERVMREIG